MVGFKFNSSICKLFLASLLTISLIFVGTGCQSKKKETSSAKEKKLEEQNKLKEENSKKEEPKPENIAQNMLKSGFALTAKDWVYYFNGNNGQLFKIKSDGRSKTLLSDDKGLLITIKDEWIYYINASDGYRIYKIRTKGSNRTKLTDDVSIYIEAFDDWIYYCNLSDLSKLYKIKLDGTGRTKITSESANDVVVSTDWVYYTDKLGSGLYKLTLNGTNKTKLTDDFARNLKKVGEWIYYRGKSDSEYYKIKLDGTGKTKLSQDDYTYDVNAAGGWTLYYMSEELKKFKSNNNGNSGNDLNSDLKSDEIAKKMNQLFLKYDNNMDKEKMQSYSKQVANAFKKDTFEFILEFSKLSDETKSKIASFVASECIDDADAIKQYFNELKSSDKLSETQVEALEIISEELDNYANSIHIKKSYN